LSDIVERLRNPLHGTELRIEAAAEIERLRGQVEKLTAALKQISQIQNKEFGPDWEEIEEARAIALSAIPSTNGRPDWCQGADSVCHHPACSCITPHDGDRP